MAAENKELEKRVEKQLIIMLRKKQEISLRVQANWTLVLRAAVVGMIICAIIICIIEDRESGNRPILFGLAALGMMATLVLGRFFVDRSARMVWECDAASYLVSMLFVELSNPDRLPHTPEETIKAELKKSEHTRDFALYRQSVEVVKRYTFRQGGIGTPDWFAEAYPVKPGKTGSQSYYIDHATNVLRFAPCLEPGDPPADASSEPYVIE